MCPGGATCLYADCYFSELALYESNWACWSRTKRTSSSAHWKLTCSRHDIAETTIPHSLHFPALSVISLLLTRKLLNQCDEEIEVITSKNVLWLCLPLQYISVTNDYGYVTFVVITIGPFLIHDLSRVCSKPV